MLKVKKVSDKWYRIILLKDKWDIPVQVVDIIKNVHGEFSVSYGETEVGEQLTDLNRYIFKKISNAKIFGMDVALSIKDESTFPNFLDTKYITD